MPRSDGVKDDGPIPRPACQQVKVGRQRDARDRLLVAVEDVHAVHQELPGLGPCGLDVAGVAVVPFNAFGAGHAPDWYLLSVGAVSVADLSAALDSIEAAIRQLNPA